MVGRMRRVCCLSLLASMACGAGQVAPDQRAAAATDDDPPAVPAPDPVQLDAVADVSAIAPGQVFTVAARLRVAPGWHVYWLNPGEAGRPTVGTLHAPAGFTAGPLRYPGPSSFEGAGGMRLYGYAGEVMLSAEIAAPDVLTGDAVPIAIEAEWLACGDGCVKGAARTELRLAHASDALPSQPVNGPLFARHIARLVEPLGDACAVDGWEADAVTLVCAGASEAEFFPSLELQPSYTGQLASTRDGAVKLRIGLRQPGPVAGVARVTTAAGATFRSVALSPP